SNNFLFQLGAIKKFRPIILKCSNTSFQFQYGAFKSCPSLNIHESCILHFNSNMVRLRELNSSLRQYSSPYFNSNMVRLRGNKLPKLNNNGKNYNSNMVRLRGKEERKQEVNRILQYQ